MPIRTPPTQYNVVELRGGLDQVTPTLSLKPGFARDSVNFECAPTGGYTRVGGYERYDGHAKPSDADYQRIQVVAFTNTPTVGQTLTGNSSGATGYIVAVTSTYMVLTQVVGVYTAGEVVKVGATTIGTSTTLSTAMTAKEGAQYLAASAGVYRALISAVPGSGAIRGVFGFTVSGANHVYAFRDNVGATSADLWESSASGWTQIAYKHEISFTTGSVSAPVEGELMTQGGVTATVRRTMDSSGSFAATTAAGRLVIDAPSGGVFAAGAATFPSGATVVLTGASTLIAMQPGGKFEVNVSSITGGAALRLYGCDGVNRAFDFDGVTLAPIPTGSTPDNPKHIDTHKNHLILGIQNTLSFSGPGVPYRFLTIDSGGSIAVGDTITGFLVQPGAQTTAALAIYTQKSTQMLYGTGLATWNLVVYNTGTGGAHYTSQNMSQSFALDNLGVEALQTTLAYGNFQSSTLTNKIQTFINDKYALASASSVCRSKSQYRLFFTDGFGLYLTFASGRLIGSMPVFFPVIFNVTHNTTRANGAEATYAGGTDGYVYELDVGSSFDGESIVAYVTLNWNAMGSPRVLKRFRHASVEMQGSQYAEINFGYQIGYGTTELGQSASGTVYASGFSPPAAWDTFIWDTFVWDGRTLFPTEVDQTGTAENIQVTISATGDYIYPFTINSVVTHYTPRRGLR